MPEKSITFKLIKSIYVIILVLGLVGSTLLFIVGLYALSDGEDNTVFYENIMKYYGIDELNFEPAFNESISVYNYSSHYTEDNLNKQNFFGTIMVFVGIVSVIFELIGLIGAIRESLLITLTILILMIIGTVSGLFTIKTIDVCTVATQLFFIILAALYVILLKRELTRGRHSTRNGSNDVEMNRNGRQKNEPIEKYITIGGGPPPYQEVARVSNKELI